MSLHRNTMRDLIAAGRQQGGHDGMLPAEAYAALTEKGLIAKRKRVPVGGPGPKGYYYMTPKGRALHRRFLADLNAVWEQYA